MPLCMDPQARVPYVLESDRGKEKPPTFFLRPLTVRLFREANTIDDQMRGAEDPITVLMNGIRLGLVGWENVTSEEGKPIPFAAESLEDVIGMQEAVELIRAVNTAGKLSIDEKKVSDLLPSSSMDNSAETASPASV